jgi:hypothetical protein
LIAVALYLVRGARPAAPDIDTFLAGTGPAWYSPPLIPSAHERAAKRAGAAVKEPAGS